MEFSFGSQLFKVIEERFGKWIATLLLLLVMAAIAAFAWGVIWNKAILPITTLSKDLQANRNVDVSIPGFFPLVTNIGALLLAAWVLGTGIGFLWNRIIKKQELPTPTEEKPLPTLTFEQVAQRVAFVQRLQGLGAQFAWVIQPGASGRSLGGIFTKAYGDPATRASVEKSPLLAQTTRLLKHAIEVLSGNVSRYRFRADALNSSLTDAQMKELCNKTRNLFQEYKRLLGEVLQLLMELRLRGVLSVYADPWSDLIDNGPGKDFDELGRQLIDLRSNTPPMLQELLPSRVDIGSFTSEFVQPHRGLQ